LNSRFWLRRQFDRIRNLPDESARLKEIASLVNWTDPGPGGFYDDLGNPRRQPRLVPGQGFAADPQFFASPLVFFDNAQTGRKSWWDQGAALYDQRLGLKYEGLVPAAPYKVRVVYGAGPVRLRANLAYVIHGYLEKPFQVLEFAVPLEATRHGELLLQWNRPPGAGGAGRGCQVAEVWLMRHTPAE
jgi:hypothetical protein